MKCQLLSIVAVFLSSAAAFTAPHWPMQAFEDDIARYRGKYKIGWDKLREQRQIELGLIDPNWPLSPRTPGIPAWNTLSASKKVS